MSTTIERIVSAINLDLAEDSDESKSALLSLVVSLLPSSDPVVHRGLHAASRRLLGSLENVEALVQAIDDEAEAVLFEGMRHGCDGTAFEFPPLLEDCDDDAVSVEVFDYVLSQTPHDLLPSFGARTETLARVRMHTARTAAAPGMAAGATLGDRLISREVNGASLVVRSKALWKRLRLEEAISVGGYAPPGAD